MPWRGSAFTAFLQGTLFYLNTAQVLDDLRLPPGNRLEPLKGELKGFHSLQINAQWRIIFFWAEGGATYVQIVDYQ